MVRSQIASIVVVMVAASASAGVARAETIKTGGDILDETWTFEGSPYIVQGDITVPSGSFLTIEPGTVVRFASSDSQNGGQDARLVELIVRGTLAVNGTAVRPVQFVAQATPGRWYGLVIDGPGPVVRLSNLAIANPDIGIRHLATGGSVTTSAVSIASPGSFGVHISAGAPTYDGIVVSRDPARSSALFGFIVTEAGAPTLTNCVARHFSMGGIWFSPADSSQQLTVTNCTLHANGEFGVESAGIATITNSVITNHATGLRREMFSDGRITVSFSDVWNNATDMGPGVTQGAAVFAANPLYVSDTNLRLTSNSPARFAAQGGGDLGALAFSGDMTRGLQGVLWTSTTFTAAGGPYQVLGDLTVGQGATLTIEPGAALEFDPVDGMKSGNTAFSELVVRGALVAGGPMGTPVTMQPALGSPGSWGGIVLDAGSTAMTLRNVVILDPNIGVHHLATGATVTTGGVSILSPFTSGVHIADGTPTYDGIVVSGDSRAPRSAGFVITGAATPTLTNCVARDHAEAGIQFFPADSSQRLTVTNCTLHANGHIGVVSDGIATITNSVITNHGIGVGRGFNSSGRIITVSFSDVWNNTTNMTGAVIEGPGNLSEDPRYDLADLSLRPTSACIDTGTSNQAPPRDANGVTRPLDGDGRNGAAFDIGAFEFVPAAVCGNGLRESNEVCDSGPLNGTYGACNTTCTGPGPRCGDGVTNGPETCDDTNPSNDDGCLNTCVVARCGDGFVRDGVEQCDDGNTSDTDACVGSCRLATCGDGVVQAGVEECDDANRSDTDGCLAMCLAPRCGDGFVRTGVEACDDGNTVNTDACTASCQVAACGDGVVRVGVETCDDGNTRDGDGCSAACAVESPTPMPMPMPMPMPNPDPAPGPSPGPDPSVDSGGGCNGSGGQSGALCALAIALTMLRRRRPRRR